MCENCRVAQELALKMAATVTESPEFKGTDANLKTSVALQAGTDYIAAVVIANGVPPRVLSQFLQQSLQATWQKASDMGFPGTPIFEDEQEPELIGFVPPRKQMH